MPSSAPRCNWVFIILTNTHNYCWFGLGGNCGDVKSTLARAHTFIESLGSGTLHKSQLYRSEPWGYSQQNEFINQVVGIKPLVLVEQALQRIQEFERTEGRERTIKWGPRTIDIDILYWPNHTCKSTRLTLPHPRLHQRRFVLEPWVELAPNLIIPGLEKSLTHLLEACPDTGWLKVLSPYAS